MSVVIELGMYICFGCFIYYCLGNENMVDLVILRKPYEGKSPISEWLVIGLVGCFLLMNSIGLPQFNPGMRQYLQKYI